MKVHEANKTKKADMKLHLKVKMGRGNGMRRHNLALHCSSIRQDLALIQRTSPEPARADPALWWRERTTPVFLFRYHWSRFLVFLFFINLLICKPLAKKVSFGPPEGSKVLGQWANFGFPLRLIQKGKG
jgi:hypothetical protein